MPASRRFQPFTGRAVAQVGNAVALFALLLVLVNSSVLFTEQVPPAVAVKSPVRAERALLVVVDGLRADAVTPELMPHVHALGADGTFATSIVGGLIPSTVAGLRALIEGRILPPAEFVNDFRSRSSPRGGLLEAVHTAGGRVFTAGPHLWSDLYDDWIDGKLTVFGLARDDTAVLRAARAACSDPQWQMVIVQFSRPDVMAHLHGATSREYAASVTWCDQAIGELIHSTGEGTLVVITSDHGVTDAGGHAGTEPEVVRTPLVANNPSFAAGMEAVSQAYVPHLVASALGLHLSEGASKSVQPDARGRIILGLAAALAGGGALLALLGSAANSIPPTNTAFWLNTSVWVSLLLAWISPWGAAVAALGALVTAAWHSPSKRPKAALTLALGAGVMAGAVRIAIPWLSTAPHPRTQAPALGIVIVCFAAMVMGYALGNATRQASTSGLIWTGFVAVAASSLLSLPLGESVSLSTLDVRLAFRMLETPFGLPGAVLLAALRPFLPLLFLLTGVLLNWVTVKDSRSRLASLAVGAGAVIAGELAIASILLAVAASQTLSSLALGLLLRECANVLVLFPALAFAALLLRRGPTR